MRSSAVRAIDSSTVTRVKLLAVALSLTAVAAAVGGLLWPEAEGGSETYSYAAIAPDRELWWGLLGVLAVVGLVNVPLQAIATMFLVRERGSGWATVGGSLMWVGIAMQATGVAGWASAYYYPTDPGLDPTIGSAVIEAANNDQGHLFAFLVPGALLGSSAPSSSASDCSGPTWCRCGCRSRCSSPSSPSSSPVMVLSDS